MRPPPLLFDLDGTLADTIGDIGASVNHVRGLAGLPPLAREGVRAILGDGARALCERALRGNPRAFSPDDGLRAYLAHHEEQCTRTVRLFDGAREWLAAWHDAGHPLAVVTNKPEAFARRIVAHCGVADLLPVVVGGDTTAERKPSPAPLVEALRRLGAEQGQGTMIGDGQQDIRAGRAAGLRTIGALYGYRREAELRAERADAYWVRFGVVAP